MSKSHAQHVRSDKSAVLTTSSRGELSGETVHFLAELLMRAGDANCPFPIHLQLHSWRWKTELSTYTSPSYKFVK